MRLLKTHPHTSEWRGNEADTVRQKRKKKKEGLARGDRNQSSTKAIAMPPATGRRARKIIGKAQVDSKNEKKNNSVEYAKNHLSPDHT